MTRTSATHASANPAPAAHHSLTPSPYGSEVHLPCHAPPDQYARGCHCANGSVSEFTSHPRSHCVIGTRTPDPISPMCIVATARMLLTRCSPTVMTATHSTSRLTTTLWCSPTLA